MRLNFRLDIRCADGNPDMLPFDHPMSLKSILARFLGSWVFSSTAWLYEWMTANTAWQESCANLLDPLPDRAEEGLVLDLGIGPGVSRTPSERSTIEPHPDNRF